MTRLRSSTSARVRLAVARAAAVKHLRRRRDDCAAIDGEDLILVHDGDDAWHWSIRGEFFEYLEGQPRHVDDCPRGYVDRYGAVS